MGLLPKHNLGLVLALVQDLGHCWGLALGPAQRHLATKAAVLMSTVAKWQGQGLVLGQLEQAQGQDQAGRKKGLGYLQ